VRSNLNGHFNLSIKESVVGVSMYYISKTLKSKEKNAKNKATLIKSCFMRFVLK
jgi:hypothetical protein